MAAESAVPASNPNAAMPKDRRNACRSLSRSSCTSTARSSSRFSPMVASRRAKCFDVVPSCRKLTVNSPIIRSIAVAGTTAGDEVTENRPDTDTDGDGLVRMLMHGLIGDLRTGDRLVANIGRDVFGAVQRGGEAFAGVPDFFSGHVGRGGEESAGVLGELPDVIAGCLCFFVHILAFF